MNERLYRGRHGKAMGRRGVVSLAALAATSWYLAQVPLARAEGSRKELPPLKLQINKADVDLDKRQLIARMSRAAGRIVIKVYGESGILLTEENHSFQGKPAGAPLTVRWKPSSDEKVAKIEVYAYDQQNYYTGIAIIPWSLSIPHEEVVFENNSAAIGEAERPKLDKSRELILKAVEEHKDLGRITLFIAGHTDTVGATVHNRALSTRRARAIAQWFRSNGVRIPMAYEGFGESILRVKTADEIAEPRNRRVDYVLSIDPPTLASTGAAPAWKRL